MRIDISKIPAQTYTPQTLYNTMHVAHIGYRLKNQGMAMACDWFHLLRDRRGELYNPWSATSISVIEIGCGNGRLCTFLARHGLVVTGVDIYDNKDVYVRDGYKFIKHDLMQTPYPFKDNELDYCLSFDVLEHLHPRWGTFHIADMLRVSDEVIGTIACFRHEPLHPNVKTPEEWQKIISDIGNAKFKVFEERKGKTILFFAKKKE